MHKKSVNPKMFGEGNIFNFFIPKTFQLVYTLWNFETNSCTLMKVSQA